jgi:hypothetical protein
MIYDITSDGVTVWVNGENGLIGRFGRMGIDIHRPANEQAQKVCLHCTHEPVRSDDWDVFVAKMKEHFDITVSEEYKPLRFKLKKQPRPSS